MLTVSLVEDLWRGGQDVLDELGRQGVHLGNVCFDWNDKMFHIIICGKILFHLVNVTLYFTDLTSR